MDKTSEAILALKPVSFQYKSDSKGYTAIWLDCRGSAAVNPDLVVRDKEGEIVHGALRGGERDVAQRVPERAPQSRAVEGDDRGETERNPRLTRVLNRRRRKYRR